jgi:hypothetical protein
MPNLPEGLRNLSLGNLEVLTNEMVQRGEVISTDEEVFIIRHSLKHFTGRKLDLGGFGLFVVHNFDPPLVLQAS